MFDFTDEQKMVRKMLRAWVEKEIVPINEKLESGEILPFEPIRKFIKTFQIDEMARAQFKRLVESEARGEKGEAAKAAAKAGAKDDAEGGMAREAALMAIVAIELSRVSPGFAMSLGATQGLYGGAVMRRGTLQQKRRFGLAALTGEKIGAWGMTEPGAGSDAFGGMRTTARRAEGGYVLNGQKTFITNAPYADLFLVYAKLEHQDLPMRERPIHSFIVEKGTQGISVSKPMKKMGMWGSPTGEIFLSDCFVPADQLLGEVEKEPSREGARDVFHGERTGIMPMALGIIEKCLEVSLAYAKQREAWGRPIAEYQLIQQKLARMYVHYQNVRNLLFKHLWMEKHGVRMTMGEASAIKAYCAPAATEVAMEAVQILGGNGYMREYHVEQLARDAKLLQIGGGTDEIQQITCAKALLRGDMVLGIG